jgi:hypothetical protein
MLAAAGAAAGNGFSSLSCWVCADGSCERACQCLRYFEPVDVLCWVLLVLQRILKVDYHIPSHIKLSPEGHDLLKKVLVADPANRINVQQVCGV